MKNINDKIKKVLLEEKLSDITITNGNPPDGFEKVTKEIFEKKDGEGCQVAKGSDGKYYFKIGSCPSTPPPPSNEWGECLETHSGFLKNLKFFDNYATAIAEGPTLYKFNKDFTLEVETDSADKYTGFWRCYGEALKMATCEDKQVLYTKWSTEWTADTENWGEKVGCKKTSSNTGGGGGSFTWKTDCGDSLKKGCKDDKIEKLQACLNKDKTSKLPELTPDGKWGKKTQAKVEELIPDYKDDISSSEIDDVCEKIETPEEVVEPITTTTTTEPVYKIRRLESKKSKKLTEQKIDIENEEIDVSDAKNFFRMAAEYGCLPDWFLYNVNKNNEPEVYSYPEYKEPFIYGSSKNDTSKKYFFFKNFTAINTLTKESRPWICEKLQNYVRRPIKSPILDKFGIDYNLEYDDMVIALNNVTKVLQTYVSKNAVSNDIMSWNNMLKKYANDNNINKLNFSPRTDAYPPADVNELNRVYKQVSTQYDKIVMYMPRRTDNTYVEGGLSGEETTTCASYLKNYLAHAILFAAGAETDIMPDIDNVRSSVIKCSNQGNYKNIVVTESDLFKLGYYSNMPKTPFRKISNQLKWKDISKFLRGENYNGDYNGKVLKPSNPYSIRYLTESLLSNKIKSTLNEIVLDKRKKLLQEEILKKRVEFLMENTTFKSRKQRREFVISLIKEAFYVESQGYDKQIIKEEFWDVLKGFFGNEGSEAVFTSFKTRMGEWLTSHLSPKKNDGWIGNCIRKTIQDINMRDVHMITDCKFLSKKIASSVIQKLDEKMSNEKLKDEGLYDIVRGGMSDNIKSANFTNHIEGKVSDMICPILETMSNKFDDAFKGMKKRAIGL